MMNIYVGNLSYDLTQQEIESEFAKYGEVGNVNLIIDKFTQRSKGFGFVEMPNDEQASTAIENLNGSSIKGRNIVVNEARPRQS